MDFIVHKDNYHNVNDTPFLLKDLIQGDESVAEREDFKLLSDPEIKRGLDLILSNPNLSSALKQSLMLDLWRINYKQKPPTMKEFLTEKWIGSMSESIFVHNREILENFWDFKSGKRHLILASSIGTGKALPASCPVQVGEEDVIVLDFDQRPSLEFRLHEKVLIQENGMVKFIDAASLRDRDLNTVDFLYEEAYLCYMIYQVQHIEDFRDAFGIEDYESLILFFKKFSQDYYRENEIFVNKHHILPVSEGGITSEDNLVVLPLYFHIKAHYLRAKEHHRQGRLRFAYYNYVAAYRLSGVHHTPRLKNLKSDIEFYKHLDIVMKAFEQNCALQRMMFFVSKDGEKSIKIFEDEWETYKADGWVKGRNFKNLAGKRWMHRGTQNVYVYPDQIDSFLAEGYIMGMYVTKKYRESLKTKKFGVATLNTKWVHRGDERRCVKLDKLSDYLAEGWELGSGSKTVSGQTWKWQEKDKGKYHWYTDGTKEVYTDSCPDGFHQGRITRPEAITKQKTALKKLLSQVEYRQMLSRVHKGIPCKNKGKVGITDGVVNRYIDKNTPLPKGFRYGWVLKKRHAD